MERGPFGLKCLASKLMQGIERQWRKLGSGYNVVHMHKAPLAHITIGPERVPSRSLAENV